MVQKVLVVEDSLPFKKLLERELNQGAMSLSLQRQSLKQRQY